MLRSLSRSSATSHRDPRSRWPALLGVLVLAMAVASCDDQDPTGPQLTSPVAAIVDANSGGSPDFFWLPPMAPTRPAFTGPFDPSALNELTVDIYSTDENGNVDHRVESFTSKTGFVASRIHRHSRTEAFSAIWLTRQSHVRDGEIYRVVVSRNDTELGSIDVKIVRSLRQLRRVDGTEYQGVIRGLPVRFRFRVQTPAATGRVVINEVESNGDETDWVELYNVGEAPIDLSGYGLKDNDDTRDFTVAEGTVLAPGAFLVLDDSEFDFGLGGDDEVRLYAPDGETIVDQYAWTEHAPTTYGRCDDGEGEFLLTTVSTRGAPNLCLPDVRINEIESSGGEPGDWVELYNYGSVSVDLSGYTFKDSDDSHAYALPSGSVLEPGAFLVLDAADFDFGLGGGDSARLFDPDGVTLVDEHAWESHATTTYGRCPDGLGPFATTLSSTRGAPNSCAAPPTTIKINEVESNGDETDWVELINIGTEPVDVSGFGFKDNDDTRTFTIAEGTTIPAGGFLVLDDSEFDFGLGGGDSARLFAPDGVTVLDAYTWESHAATTYGRCPDGTGDFFTTASSTRGLPNDCEAQVADIRINEIESSGGEPGDWVELYNFGSVEVDVSGYAFKDSDDTRTFTIAPGTVIQPGGYLVLEESDFDFGLGGADAARLFDVDGVTLVDGFTWESHAATTYARCPDGLGPFVTAETVTRGGANSCPAATTAIVVNEVESSGGTPGDWVEFFNTGAESVDLSGYLFKDGDDSHAFYTIPTGTIVAPGGYLVLGEGDFGYGLGGGDATRLFAPDGLTLVATYEWASHAATTYGRCPDGTGAFFTTTTSTQGAANDCSVAVVLNEIESSGGDPDDWVEFYNPSPLPVDLGGYVFRDNNDAGGYTLPAGTSIPGSGYLVLEAADFGFGLGASDAARLFAPGGDLIDGYAWTSHSTLTWGRCPDGTGDFDTTTESTKGATNICPGEIPVRAWPGADVVTPADSGSVFGGDLSGLAYQASGSATPGVMWGSRNGGPGAIFRLVWDGGVWTPDTGNGWGAGRAAVYPDGTGEADAEGITTVGSGASTALYLATERNNANSGVSRNSILRYDASAAGATMVATHEWNVTADLPANTANTGLEGIAWIPDGYLVSAGFLDASTGAAYDPANYPDHAGGLFFVGVEASGMIYAFALNHTDGSFNRVATIESGFAGVMGLEFDSDDGTLWAICDDGCGGLSAILTIDGTTGSATQGHFVVTTVVNRPAGMPNLNNEGIAFGSSAECMAGEKPVYWADDGETGGNAIRRGSRPCTM